MSELFNKTPKDTSATSVTVSYQNVIKNKEGHITGVEKQEHDGKASIGTIKDILFDEAVVGQHKNAKHLTLGGVTIDVQEAMKEFRENHVVKHEHLVDGHAVEGPITNHPKVVIDAPDRGR